MIEIRGCGIEVTKGDVDVGDDEEKKEVVSEGGGGGVVGEAVHGGVSHRELELFIVCSFVAFRIDFKD